MKIIMVYGGKSAEHEISLLSAFSILQAVYYEYYQVQLVYITKKGIWLRGPLLEEAPKEKEILQLSSDSESGKDVAFTYTEISPYDLKEKDAIIFPVLHGPNGEDGTIQGLFEMMDMPYVGAGVLASSCAMDKIMTKYIFQQAGIPQVPYVPIIQTKWKVDPEEALQRCEGSLLYPMYVKPANLGSSVGISRAEDLDELKSAIEKALQYDRRVIVEQGIEAREIEVAVLGNEDVRSTFAGEIVKDVEFYDYESKYIDNQVQLQIPAAIPDAIQNQARAFAEKAYTMLDGSGLSRCDFFLSGNQELFLNEINTMPGFTPFSMYPLLWENMGLSYGDLIEELLQLALLRFKQKKDLLIE